MTDTNDNYFIGKLLIAMPNMDDERFNQAVILVCVHDEKGAMGLVLNSEMKNVDFSELIDQLNLNAENLTEMPDLPVMRGGPVDESRGFLLHSSDFEQPDTVLVKDDYRVSGSVDALKHVIEGTGPDKMKFILGYSGWGPGQLDKELTTNSWLAVDPDPNLVFATAPTDMWSKAIEKIGINPSMLSNIIGHA